jgi:hypothetical protein
MSSKYTREIEEAAALGKRFPDFSDEEVMEKVADILGGDPTNPKSPVGIIMLIAYEGGEKAASRASLAMFGVDMAAQS